MRLHRILSVCVTSDIFLDKKYDFLQKRTLQGVRNRTLVRGWTGMKIFFVLITIEL